MYIFYHTEGRYIVYLVLGISQGYIYSYSLILLLIGSKSCVVRDFAFVSFVPEVSFVSCYFGTRGTRETRVTRVRSGIRGSALSATSLSSLSSLRSLSSLVIFKTRETRETIGTGARAGIRVGCRCLILRTAAQKVTDF